MEQKEIIAVNLANYRKKAGYSQLELAKKLNYSNKNISKWENGEATPSVYILKNLANLYGIAIDDFFSEKTVDVNQVVDMKTKMDKRKKNLFRIFMLLLANAILFCVVSAIIYVLGYFDLNGFNRWLLYLYALPLNLLSVLIYVGVLYKFVEFICLSAIGWVVCVSVFVSLIETNNIAFIFLVGAGYQFIAICFTLLLNLKFINKVMTKYKKKKILNKSETNKSV